MCLRISEHPYLISIAFDIAEGCCCIFINSGYAVSCFPVEPFSSASSENVYKTIIRMSMGLVCVVLWHLISERVFGAKYDHTFLNLQITRSDIRPHIKWPVSLVIAYGHFNLPQGIVWVCMSSHTHFITPRAQMTHLMKHTSYCSFLNVFAMFLCQ